MTPEERQRVGRVLKARMAVLDLTVPDLAGKADVDPTTIRAILRGQRTPRAATRERIADAVGWPLGDHAEGGGECNLAACRTTELLDEIDRRVLDDRIAPVGGYFDG